MCDFRFSLADGRVRIISLLGWGLLLSAPAEAAVKAFPTAEGFGANAVGGRGGRVIEVTNLNDAGPGSLRDCAEATGARICVFRVSGTIALSSPIRISGDAASYLTIAGQTSPGGIQLKGDGLQVQRDAHDVIVRHLRFRPGTHLPQLEDTNGFIAYGNGGHVYNVIVDHCSSEWSDDQNGPDAINWVTNYTVQWCLIAEGTTEGNVKGFHSTGLMADRKGWPELTVSIHHNLIAHNDSRNPLISSVDIADVRNNIVYNWGNGRALQWGNSAEQDQYGYGSAFGNFVNNHYIAGPNSYLKYFFLSNGGPIRRDGSLAERGGTKIYTEGNWGPNCPRGCADDWRNGFYDDWDYAEVSPSQYRALTPYPVPPVTTDATSELMTKILPTVGASKSRRDSVDARIVNDVYNRTGDLWSVGAGGPWPDLAAGAPQPPADTDRDGMPDSWETAHGLNPANASDGSQTASNGYTNVENYLNELAGDPIPGVIPPTAITLTASPTAVQPGAPLTVSWQASGTVNAKDWIGLDWIGLYLRSQTDNRQFVPNAWRYTNGTPSGSLTVSAPMTSGTYEFRYLLNDGYTSVAMSPPVTVTLAALRGDLNGDGTRDLADVRLLIYMLLGQQATTPEADLTGDGAVTLADVQALIRLMVGLP